LTATCLRNGVQKILAEKHFGVTKMNCHRVLAGLEKEPSAAVDERTQEDIGFGVTEDCESSDAENLTNDSDGNDSDDIDVRDIELNSGEQGIRESHRSIPVLNFARGWARRTSSQQKENPHRAD